MRNRPRRSPAPADRRTALLARRAAPAAAVALVASLVVALAPGAAAQPAELSLQPVVDGLASPTDVTHAGDDRLFVVERRGTVRVVLDGELLPGFFLDLRDRVGAGGERGLLGLAFHPDFLVNGRFFVNYTDADGNTVIARFEATHPVVPGDPAGPLEDTERVLLRVDQPFANHNGGGLDFGPDGYLYAGLGDGGAGFDPDCNAQDLGNLLGKVLRLDVDTGSGSAPWHTVPPDNPFVGVAGARAEIWIYGLRNPWRIAFDPATGDFYAGDVGQNQREEIDFRAAAEAGGGNYGWKLFEGTLCLGDASGCGEPAPTCASLVQVGPVVEYGHAQGRCSVTGGRVYRGGVVDGLDGWYFYGDHCSGEIFLTRRRVPIPWQQVDTGLRVPGLTTFGEDRHGELYATGLEGTLFRITGPSAEPFDCVADDTTLCLGADGRFQVRATFRVGDGPTRQAQTGGITSDTGYFWYFDEDNLEVVVKALDGCGVNGHYWVFAGGLTDVESEVVVVDSDYGRSRRYPNPPQTPFQPVQDTAAFPTCP